MIDGVGRRTVLRGALGLAALGGVAGIVDLGRAAATDRSNGTDKLRVGYLPITDAAPLLVAHGADLFQPEVVSSSQPVMFRSWSSLAEAFISRQVDVVHLLMPMAVQLKYSLGSSARILGWNHTNGSALTVAPHITDLEQLAGTQVAVPFWWSIHNIVLQDMLRARGLTPVVRTAPSKAAGTVGLVVMSPSDMVPALANGAISAYTVADPFNAVAEIKGIGKIHCFLGDVWRDHACCALLVHQDVIDRNPAAVQGLTDSIVAAQMMINADRPAAAAMLSGGRYLPQPEKAIAKALTYPPENYQIANPSWSPQKIGYQPFPFESFTTALVGAMHSTVVDGNRDFLDRIDIDTVHQELIDDRFVRSSIAGVGGPSAFGLPTGLTRTEEVDLT
ncbi:ABC transporter substrate-binding protein [Tomitella biformata]|uniref:ABC transporter substrate-binding protein n=1 Tax=Tomitella biformata TaxID=630403 RepID=UPI0004654802|nr:ABC transporter substrate-binding protein [Tomitella biformata]